MLSTPHPIPLAQLRRLEFLLGEFEALETLYPPDGGAVQFPASLSGSREACERYVKIEFFAEIPDAGIETFSALLTYSKHQSAYRMWVFLATQEEPIVMSGEFQANRLVLVSDPTPMVWGMQRLRYSLAPLPNGGVDLLGERWEPDGYAKYCTAQFRPR